MTTAMRRPPTVTDSIDATPQPATGQASHYFARHLDREVATTVIDMAVGPVHSCANCAAQYARLHRPRT
ncbi:hypothetical protein ACIQF5_21635 [Streptomyces goshikiensis]|uniref:hypothetical protein n=1 Tax=Streptomyces goshikiensis TaxID=1942 RepID=UPI00381D34D5